MSSVLRNARMRVGAPALVVLASVVNAAVAGVEMSPAYLEGQPQASLQISWAVHGGPAHSSQTARVLIARKAASTICSLDRLQGARAAQFNEPAALIDSGSSEFAVPEYQRAYSFEAINSSHQHCAP